MAEHILADSGARQEFDSGAVRDIKGGKGRFDLISPLALRRLALVYERGAAKYADRNWEKGIPFGSFLDSATRHLNDYAAICLFKREGWPLEGLPKDINPNEDHLAQAMWNIASLLHFEETRPDLDNLTRKSDAAYEADIKF